MNINVADLLSGNDVLLLFVVLALRLCLGKLRPGSVHLGNSIGVLVVSLLLGQQHLAINTDALNLGFMLFIFCVGVEAGPNFFSIFFRDGKNYFMLAIVMVVSALLLALGFGKLFGWDIGLTAGCFRRHHALLSTRQPSHFWLYPTGRTEDGERVWADGIHSLGSEGALMLLCGLSGAGLREHLCHCQRAAHAGGTLIVIIWPILPS